MPVAVFAFDSADAAQVRRIRAIADGPFDTRVFSFRRDPDRAPFDPPFRNVHLGWSHHGKLRERVWLILVAVARVIAHRRAMDGVRVIVARNLDMLAIAWAVRALVGPRDAALVYECLDIHPAMTRGGRASAMLRRIERGLLARCALLAVSSNAYLREYFQPRQGYSGPAVLWENKLQPQPPIPDRPTERRAPDAGRIRLGYVGSIRCRRSLMILSRAARAMDGALEVHVHGGVNLHALPDFDAIVRDNPHLHHHGPFRYPADIPAIYGGLDIVWNLDFQARGMNSAWALSNRLYEASWCGCPSLAEAGTEVGRYVADNRLGWLLEDDRPETLVALLRALPADAIWRRGRDLLARPRHDFESDGSDVRAALLCLGARAPAP